MLCSSRLDGLSPRFPPKDLHSICLDLPALGTSWLEADLPGRYGPLPAAQRIYTASASLDPGTFGIRRAGGLGRLPLVIEAKQIL